MPSIDASASDRTIKRALLSVYRKEGLVDLGRSLITHGVELYASSGTYTALKEGDVPVNAVETLTEVGELFGGRVKTLHPKIHGGILMNREDEEHLLQAKKHNIHPFDLIVINLYPFEEVSGGDGSGEEVLLEQALEMIDIGGPTLLRAAAKNFRFVTVLTDPSDYKRVIEGFAEKASVPYALREEFALKAFAHTANYDRIITERLGNKFRHGTFTGLSSPEKSDLADPTQPTLSHQHASPTETSSTDKHMPQGRPLRYGENPHQQAFLETRSSADEEAFAVSKAELIRGEALSYNNILDSVAAVRIIREVSGIRPRMLLSPNTPSKPSAPSTSSIGATGLSEKASHGEESADHQASTQIRSSLLENDVPGAVVIKHGTPCGLALAPTTTAALQLALEGDIVSRYGSVIAVNTILDEEAAQALRKIYVEIILAPGYTDAALKNLERKNKRMRILSLPGLLAPRTNQAPFVRRELDGGMALIQERDEHLTQEFRSEPPSMMPTPTEDLLRFAEASVKHTKSNAITIVSSLEGIPGNTQAHHDEPSGWMLLGLGAGQPNRLDAVTKLAIPKMQENLLRLYGDSGRAKQAAGRAILASDAFFPFPDSLYPIHQSGIRTILQPGGSIRDEDVISEAQRLGLHMIFTGMRHFSH